MIRMPSLLRPAVLALLASAAFALLATPASAAFPATEVTIVSPTGKQASISLDEISVPENWGTYPIRDRNRPQTSVTVANGDGISVRQILVERELDLGYGTIEIQRPNGTTLVLDKDEVNSPNYSPTFYVDDGGQLWFLRPSTGSGDYNAADHFRIGTAAVELTQTPASLTVSVKASPKKIDPGESISFTVTVKGGPRNAEYRYDWNFDDGQRIADGRPKETHKFVKAGKFDVLVTVKIVGESRSDGGVAKVQVGEEKKSDKDREGGGTNTTGGADSGSSTGSSGAGSTYGGGSSGYTPSYTPSTTPPTPTPPPSPAPAPSTQAPEPPDIASSGTTVEGNLLADVGDPPPSDILESAASAARDGTPKDADAEDGADVPEAALSIAGVLALLGLGAGIETRQGRPLRLRLPRRAA